MPRNNIGFSRISLALIIAVLFWMPGLGHASAQDEKPRILVQEQDYTAVVLAEYGNAAVEVAFMHSNEEETPERFRPSVLADGDEVIIKAEYGTTSMQIIVDGAHNAYPSQLNVLVPAPKDAIEQASWEEAPTCAPTVDQSTDTPTYTINVKSTGFSQGQIVMNETCAWFDIVPPTRLQLDQKALKKEVRSWMSDTGIGTLTLNANSVRYVGNCTIDFQIPDDLELQTEEGTIALAERTWILTDVQNVEGFTNLIGVCKASFFFSVVTW